MPLPRAVSMIPTFPRRRHPCGLPSRAGPSTRLGSKPAPACSAEAQARRDCPPTLPVTPPGIQMSSGSRWGRGSFPQTTHHRRRFPEPKRLPPMNPGLPEPACASRRPSRHWCHRFCRRDPASDMHSRARSRVLARPALPSRLFTGAGGPHAVHRLLQSNGPTSTPCESSEPGGLSRPKPHLPVSPSSSRSRSAELSRGQGSAGTLAPDNPRAATARRTDLPQPVRLGHLMSRS